MPNPKLPPEFLLLLQSITGKRPKTVIDHILEHGHITTEELKSLYGYNHPPRAARDVRELGIPLVTVRIKDSVGRSVAAYKFGDLRQVRKGRLGGRRVFPLKLKEDLAQSHGKRCSICLDNLELRYLQIDHRVPYEIQGESQGVDRAPEEFMLVCPSCNRAKSWSCEHCPNWLEGRSIGVCSSCYWANPLDHGHVAMRQARRLDLVWMEAEVAEFDLLKGQSDLANEPLPEFVKSVLRRHLQSRKK